MSRFPPIPDLELSDAQKRTDEGVAQLFSRFPHGFKWKNDEGLALGPYAPLLCVTFKRVDLKPLVNTPPVTPRTFPTRGSLSPSK